MTEPKVVTTVTTELWGSADSLVDNDESDHKMAISYVPDIVPDLVFMKEN